MIRKKPANLLMQVMQILDNWELVPEDEEYDNNVQCQDGDGTTWNNAIRVVRKDVQHLLELELRNIERADHLVDDTKKVNALTWTAEKPTAAGWYWWRPEDNDLNPIVCWVSSDGIALFINFAPSTVRDMPGEWLGPLTPE